MVRQDNAKIDKNEYTEHKITRKIQDSEKSRFACLIINNHSIMTKIKNIQKAMVNNFEQIFQIFFPTDNFIAKFSLVKYILKTNTIYSVAFVCQKKKTFPVVTGTGS
jgi:hypothetical protein